MKVEEVFMTPADAARLLDKNEKNRKLSRQRARGYTVLIERGEWQLDGNPIKIADDGHVLDGQHRLQAIADADTDGVPVLLATGVPASARMVVDCGRARSFADYLELNAVPNSLSMAAAVRGAWNYEQGLFDWRGDWFKRPVPSLSTLWELYERRRPIFEEAVKHANQVLRLVRVGRATVATAWVAFGDVECSRCGPVSEDLPEFFEQLTMRSVGPASDGATTFIRHMNSRGTGSPEAKSGRISYSATEQLALLIKAWNAYREGKPVTTLRWTRGGKNREKFPTPH